ALLVLSYPRLASLLSGRPRDRPALHAFPTRRSSDLGSRRASAVPCGRELAELPTRPRPCPPHRSLRRRGRPVPAGRGLLPSTGLDRKSTRLNSSHVKNSYAVFCLKKKIQDIDGRHVE